MSSVTNNQEAQDLWRRGRDIFLATLPSNEERNRAQRHLSMITTVNLNEGTLEVLVANEFAVELIRKEYAEKISFSLKLAGSGDLGIEYKLDASAHSAIRTPVAPQPQQVAAGTTRTGAVTAFASTMPLNDDFTFEEFVQGPSNSFAYAAAQNVAENPGQKEYNPLFIHGGTGLGKTHLMQAIGNAIRKKDPSLKVCYLTAETFLNEFVNGLQNGTIQQFKNHYRSIDVLLVDDIQFIAQRKQFQEEFFNTFNSLYGSKKQIVMTSDVAPKKLDGFEERLVSRFEGGMVHEIETPSYETRLAILRKKADAMRPTVPDNALQFIAENIKSHVRAMEGALGKVHIWTTINPATELNAFMLAKMLCDFIEKEKNLRKLTIEEIQATVSRRYAVTIAQILSSERTQTLVTPRQVAMFIARKFTTSSLPEIAKKFDKSHATILHGVKNIERRLDVEPELKSQIEAILGEFGYTLSDKAE